MKIISATEAKTNFGKYISAVMLEPVTVSKADHEVIVMISKKEYDRLKAYDDAYWTVKAHLSEKNGYLGEMEGKKIIENLLNA